MYGVYTGGYVHQLVKVRVTLQLDFFLCLCVGECPNRWDHMCVHKNIHTPDTHAWEAYKLVMSYERPS